MSSTFDYKWRKRMCHKWEEEQREQQRQFPPPLVRTAQSTVACKSLRTFADDPMNLHKLFLSRRTLQLLLKQRSDFQRLVKGCFVRVKFGAGHSVAQIQGLGKWRTSSSSSMGPALILRIDHNARVFDLQHLSNSYYEPRELLEWQLMWQSCNFELPSKSLVEQKYKLLTNAKLQLQAQEVQQTTCIIHKLATPTQCSQSCLVHGQAAPTGGRHSHRSQPPQQQPPSDAKGES